VKPFSLHTGRVAPLPFANVDTDQIIPKQFLKRIERSGFGQFLFYDWRFHEDGSVNETFTLNSDCYQGSSILLAKQNFGCGSSREHAPWALLDYGFKVIIAPSFADIFYNNCFKNGILPICLNEEQIDDLFEISMGGNLELTVNLELQELTSQDGLHIAFTTDSYRRSMLLEGLDDIGLTEKYENQILKFEEKRIFI
jgi:3-isopropylmalate/(R)-2-methylmalate dehydratase small subunit